MGLPGQFSVTINRQRGRQWIISGFRAVSFFLGFQFFATPGKIGVFNSLTASRHFGAQPTTMISNTYGNLYICKGSLKEGIILGRPARKGLFFGPVAEKSQHPHQVRNRPIRYDPAVTPSEGSHRRRRSRLGFRGWNSSAPRSCVIVWRSGYRLVQGARSRG